MEIKKATINDIEFLSKLEYGNMIKIIKQGLNKERILKRHGKW